MATVALDIEDHHGSPHRRNHGHFQPSHLMSVDDVRDVAPQVVVAKPHISDERAVAGESTITMVTQRNLAVAAQSIACFCASVASSNVLGATDDAIVPFIKLLIETMAIHVQGAFRHLLP